MAKKKDNSFFWAFFIIALVAGVSLGFSVNNVALSGQAARLTNGDSDGGFDVYEFGECKDINGVSSFDFCSGNFLHEFAFINGECMEKTYACNLLQEDFVCYKGECVSRAQWMYLLQQS